MSATKQDWLKGSFPSWLVAGLLAGNAYFLKGHIDRTEAMLHNHEHRISKLEGRGMASRLSPELFTKQSTKAHQ